MGHETERKQSSVSPVDKLKDALEHEGRWLEQVCTDDSSIELGTVEITDEMKGTISIIGWPDAEDRNTMTWKCFPENDEAFRLLYFDESFSSSSLRALNNAVKYFETAPCEIVDGNVRIAESTRPDEPAYSTAPHLMRANLLAPETFEAVRLIFKESRQKICQELCDELLPGAEDEKEITSIIKAMESRARSKRQQEITASIDEEDRVLVLKTLRLLYVLMGKLVRSDDPDIHDELLGAPRLDGERNDKISDIGSRLYG